MDNATLQERMTAIEQRFNALVSQRDEINQELLRLQGEHRVLTDLVAEKPSADYEVAGTGVDSSVDVTPDVTPKKKES